MELSGSLKVGDPVTNPLDALHHFLEEDMKATNDLIIERLQSSAPIIPKVAGHLIKAGGKRIRPLLTLAGVKLFDGDMARAHKLATTIEYIHSATLLHDDVVDESTHRRGRPSANRLFANKPSILVGDFLFARAFELMVETANMRILEILSKTSRLITEGEIQQISIEHNFETTQDDYFQVIESKTAALFSAACEVGPVIAGSDETQIEAMRSYGFNLGMAFQIVDDVLDYKAEQKRLGKTLGDDFREGKFTLPVIYALENANGKETVFWQTTMIDQDQGPDDLKTAVMLLEKSGSFERCMTLAESYAAAAVKALEPVAPSLLKQRLIEVAEDSVTRRN